MNSLFEKDFALSIGPQKCGTRWLEAYLKGRSDVCLPGDAKEIFFFDRHFQRGTNFYKSHFAPGAGHNLIMELTTTLFDVPEAPQRVQSFMGSNIRLLCPLRHPVRRAYVAYQAFVHYGIVSGELPEAVDQAPQILNSSRYTDHLQRWFEQFSRDRVKVVFYEDLENNEAAYTRDVCEGLGLSHQPVLRAQKPGKSSSKYKFSQLLEGLIGGDGDQKEMLFDEKDTENIVWLEERLSSEIPKLEEFLGYPIPSWHK